MSDGSWRTETTSFTSGTWWVVDRTNGVTSMANDMTLEQMSTSATLIGARTLQDVYALLVAPGTHLTSVQVGIGSANAGGSVYVNQLVTSFYRPGDRTTFGGPVPVELVRTAKPAGRGWDLVALLDLNGSAKTARLGVTRAVAAWGALHDPAVVRSPVRLGFFENDAIAAASFQFYSVRQDSLDLRVFYFERQKDGWCLLTGLTPGSRAAAESPRRRVRPRGRSGGKG